MRPVLSELGGEALHEERAIPLISQVRQQPCVRSLDLYARFEGTALALEASDASYATAWASFGVVMSHSRWAKMFLTTAAARRRLAPTASVVYRGSESKLDSARLQRP